MEQAKSTKQARPKTRHQPSAKLRPNNDKENKQPNGPACISDDEEEVEGEDPSNH